MKAQRVFYPFLLVCIVCTLMILSCQKRDYKTDSLRSGDVSVLSRADDCDDCGSDCCCYVELYNNDNSATIKFCGTSDGASACSGTGGCGTVNGGGQVITLSTTNPRHLFCVGLSTPFWVMNFSTTDPTDLTISCQATSGLPQVIHIHLDELYSGGTEQVFIQTDAHCEVSEC